MGFLSYILVALSFVWAAPVRDAKPSKSTQSKLTCDRLNDVDFGYEYRVQTALSDFIMEENVACILGLLDRWPHPDFPLRINGGNQTPLELAVLNQRWESFFALLSAGADPLIRSDDPQKYPLLFFVAQSNSLEAVEALIERGADVMQVAFDGNTALTWAAYSDNIEILKYLIRLGADPKHANDRGITALHSSARRGQFATSKLLITHGANPHAVSNDKTTVLHEAVEGGNVELVKFLISLKADVHARDYIGLTPLHIAATVGNIEMMKLLIASGANPYAMSSWGSTPLDAGKGVRDSASVVIAFYRELAKKQERQDRIAHWKAWVSGDCPDPNPEYFSELLHGLIALLDEKGVAPAPSKNAPETARKVYENIKIAKTNPNLLPVEALDVLNAPPGYFRYVVRGMQKANWVHSAKVGKERALRVLNRMVADSAAESQDYSAMAWLMGRVGIQMNENVLALFNLDLVKTKNDVAEMMQVEPLKYKGEPNLAAIKLAKAILAHEDTDFACKDERDYEGRNIDKGDLVDAVLGETLTWFLVYGDTETADRLLFSQIAKLILIQKKSLCALDRRLILGTMKQWAKRDGRIQREIGLVLRDRPVGGSDGLLEQARLIGVASELSETAWLEQAKFFSEQPEGTLKDTLHLGLMRYVVGAQKTETFFINTKVKLPSALYHEGAVVKLCRVTKTNPDMKPALKWIDHLSTRAEDLAQFDMRGLKADLEAVKSKCTVLPTKKTKKPIVKKRRKKGADFQP